MGHPKATLPIDDTTFVAAELRALKQAGFAPIVLVTGRHRSETTAALPADVRVEHVENPTPEQGQLSSLKLALAEIQEIASPVGALLALVDHPVARAETLLRLRKAATAEKIVVPCFEGQRGHPVVFGSRLFAELQNTPNNEGARVVVRRDAERVVEITTDDRGVVLDIDTPADLEELRRFASTGKAPAFNEPDDRR